MGSGSEVSLCTMTTAWVLGALLLHVVVAAVSAGHLANSGCFMQMEDESLTFVFVPTPNIVNGALTWHAVSSESGKYVAGHWIYWGSMVSTWSVGEEPDPEALLQAPEGKPQYTQTASCFLDFTVVVNIKKSMERTGIVMRLEAPLWTTCAPRQGSPVIRAFDKKIDLSNGTRLSSHRDCVKAGMEKGGVKLNAVIYDRVYKTCEGILNDGFFYEYVPAALDSQKAMISCAVKCLPLNGHAYFAGSPAKRKTLKGRAHAVEEVDEELNLLRSKAVGAYFSYGPFGGSIANVDSAVLTDPTSIETESNWFCFRPLNFHFGCYLLAVDSAREAECNTVYFRAFESYNHYTFTSKNSGTAWSSSRSKAPTLQYSTATGQLKCTTSKGATEIVSVRCLGDKHICLNDRKRAAVDYQKPVHPVEDIPGLCPAYRSLVWGNGKEIDLAVLHEAGSLTSRYPYLIGRSGKKFLQWKQNFFQPCDNEGYDDKGRVKCRPNWNSMVTSKHQMVCTEAGHYCMYLTVTEVDTTNGNCIGNFRQLRDRVWVKFEMVPDTLKSNLEDTDVTLTLERVEGSGDGLILECRKGQQWASRVHLSADRCLAENEYCFDRSSYPAKASERRFVSVRSGHCKGEMQRYVPDGADQDGSVFYRPFVFTQSSPPEKFGTKWTVSYPRQFRLKRHARRDFPDGYKFDCIETSSSNKVKVVEDNVEVDYKGSNHACFSIDSSVQCQYVYIRDADAGECDGAYRKVGDSEWRKFAFRPETGELDDLGTGLHRVGPSAGAGSFTGNCAFGDVVFMLRVKCAEGQTFCLDGST